MLGGEKNGQAGLSPSLIEVVLKIDTRLKVRCVVATMTKKTGRLILTVGVEIDHGGDKGCGRSSSFSDQGGVESARGWRLDGDRLGEYAG